MSSDGQNKFAIDADNGQISVTQTVVLDEVYIITVQGEDTGSAVGRRLVWFSFLSIKFSQYCGAQLLSGRMPGPQLREPGFESYFLLFRCFDISVVSTKPQLARLYKWVVAYRLPQKCD